EVPASGSSTPESAPPRPRARLGSQPLLPTRQPSVATGLKDTLGVGVTPAPSVAFGSNQHMLAERRKKPPAEWAAIGRGLARGGPTPGPPWGLRRARHRLTVAPLARSAVGMAGR